MPQALPTTLAQLARATEILKFAPLVSLAGALLHMGLLSRWELDELQREDPQLLRSKSFGLVERRLLTAEALSHALARTAGIVEVNAAQFEIAPNGLELLPLAVQRKHNMLLLGELNELLVVASSHPTSEDMHRRLFMLTSRRVMLVWADCQAINARLDLMDAPALLLPLPGDADVKFALPEKAASKPAAGGDAALQGEMAYWVAAAVKELSSGRVREEAVQVNESSSMVRMVKRLIIDAKARQASDIHIETNLGEEVTRIRLRRDGDMELYQVIPAQLRAAMISRIKVMARLDISEHRRPQDGKINFSDFGGDPLELRVAIMPTHDGMEDVVMRLLASSHPVPLAELGLQTRDAEAIARMSMRSFGLILAAGPTGSGKTTTLHSMLAEMNTEDCKIWTAEDPIEITQFGLRQVQVNPKIGLTFASAMQGFLRADPDIIMVGEIRDPETARVVVEGALTGHLVLSALHTSSAAESVVRLLDLGMEAMNFADSLVGVVAQRLVRRLCSHCAQERVLPSSEFVKAVNEYIQGSPLSEAEGAIRLLAAAGARTPKEVREKTAKGCVHCGGKGYKGQTGIYEILENDPEIRRLIQRNAQPADIYEEAIRAGMRSLRHDALEKWLQGLIDLPQARQAYL